MTDFRALCAELTGALDTWLMAHHYSGVPPQDGADAELVLRARAALAQAEPQGPSESPGPDFVDVAYVLFDSEGKLRPAAQQVLSFYGFIPSKHTNKENFND